MNETKKNITQEIFDNYWAYHQEALENAFTDTDSLVTTGKLPLKNSLYLKKIIGSNYYATKNI